MEYEVTDSTLKRHHLTEIKSKQTINFEKFMKATEKKELTIEPMYYPFWSNQVLVPMIAFAFFMALVLI